MKLIYFSILTVLFQLNSYAHVNDAGLYASVRINGDIKSGTAKYGPVKCADTTTSFTCKIDLTNRFIIFYSGSKFNLS